MEVKDTMDEHHAARVHTRQVTSLNAALATSQKEAESAMTQLRSQLQVLETKLRSEQETSASESRALQQLRRKNAQLVAELEASQAQGSRMVEGLEATTSELTHYLEAVSSKSDHAALKAEQARRREVETQLMAMQESETQACFLINASILAEISVRSPRKLFIYII